MNNLVEINNKTLKIKEYQGQRVITFKDIDRVHERPDGTARRNFTSNKKYLIENEDYFKITRDMSLDEFRSLDIIIPPMGITLITESGYLLLVKSFTDNLAWQVQRQLVSIYFKLKSDFNTENNNTENKLIELLASMDNRLSKLEEQFNKKKLPEKKYSRWKTNTFGKLNTLLSYVNDNSDENLKLSEIIHLVIGEMEDTYGIELNDYTDAYKSELDLESTPYAIDVINHYRDIRDMFTLTLDSIMGKLHIVDGTSGRKTRNIFEELAAKNLQDK